MDDDEILENLRLLDTSDEEQQEKEIENAKY